MGMKVIKGIVFDFGGVISAPQAASFWDAAQALTGWSREEIWAGWRKHRWMLDADFVTPQGLYHLMAADAGVRLGSETLDRLAQLDYDSWAIPNPETLAWAEALKREGYRIGILTNMPTSFIPWFDRAAGAFRSLADAEVISGEVHLVKPEAAIYDLMASRMGLEPEELCFLDDTPANVASARRCGWSAIEFKDVAGARRELAALMRQEARG